MERFGGLVFCAYHSEREGGVDKPFSESNVAARNRKVGNHLPKGDHHAVGDGSNHPVAKEKTNGTTILQRARRAQEETGTNNTADTGSDG